MGSIDSRGVFIYDNTDHVTPLATFMNLGQKSVSDALADLRSDLTDSDTGWVTLSLASGWTGPVQARRIGDMVHLRGTATPGLPWDSTTTAKTLLTNLPSQFQPAETFATTAASALTNGAVNFRVTVAGGTIAIRSNITTTSVYGVYMTFNYIAS